MISKERIITNHLLIDDIKLWDQLVIKENDDNHIRRYYNQLVNLITDNINESIEWLESEEARNFFFNELQYQQNLFEDLDEHLDEILDKDYISIDALLDDVYKKGKEIGYSDIDSRLKFTKTDRLALQIAKDYNYMLVNNLSDELRHQVRREMFKGLIAGEHPSKMAKRLVKAGVQPLDGSTMTPLQRANLIARTECSRMQNTGILQSYVNEGYKDIKLLTAEDDHVCTICLKYAYEFNEDSEITIANRGKERIHSIEKIMGLLPFHPACRCTVLAVWETKGEPPKKPFTTNLTEQESGIEYIEGINGKIYPIVGDTYRGRVNFERKYGINADDLSPEELDFISLYTKKGNEIINAKLRGDYGDRDLKAEWDKLAIERGIDLSFEKALKLTETIFKKGKTLQEPIVLVRRENERYMKPKYDGLYHDEGILSTTIGKTIKEDVYGDEINYILVPEGTEILYVEGITTTSKDFEVMLPPRSTLSYVRDEGKHIKVWEL